MADILNPYAAGRNIHGRWGRVFRNGIWIANATEVSYSVEIDRIEVRRAGTRWVDYKEGELTGSGTLVVDYVNSQYTKEFINYINGRDANGALLPDRTLPVWSLQVNLEDDQIPGIVKDQNGEATSGHESVELVGVKFWNMAGGYGSDMITRDYEFTFSGIKISHEITDPVNLDLP